jgi:hypothetical protein
LNVIEGEGAVILYVEELPKLVVNVPDVPEGILPDEGDADILPFAGVELHAYVYGLNPPLGVDVIVMDVPLY